MNDLANEMLKIGIDAARDIQRATTTVASSDLLVVDALRGLIKLLDDGDLVRNTSGDDDMLVFMRQGVRITNALMAAKVAMAVVNTNMSSSHEKKKDETEI